MDGDSRDRGILTEADRKYLRGDREFASVQAERNARARVRERIYESIRDVELLVEHLDERDRKLVFEKRFGEIDGTDAFDAVVSAVAFLYMGVDDTDLDFEDVLTEAINVAEARRDRAATVDLSVTYHALSADELLRRLRTGEDLSLTELAYLQGSAAVSTEELARYFDEDETVDDGRIQTKVTDF